MWFFSFIQTAKAPSIAMIFIIVPKPDLFLRYVSQKYVDWQLQQFTEIRTGQLIPYVKVHSDDVFRHMQYFIYLLCALKMCEVVHIKYVTYVSHYVLL